MIVLILIYEYNSLSHYMHIYIYIHIYTPLIHSIPRRIAATVRLHEALRDVLLDDGRLARQARLLDDLHAVRGDLVRRGAVVTGIIVVIYEYMNIRGGGGGKGREGKMGKKNPEEQKKTELRKKNRAKKNPKSKKNGPWKKSRGKSTKKNIT